MLGSLNGTVFNPGHQSYGACGNYAAPAATQPRVSQWGPTIDWTPEGREARQMYERGFAEMMSHAREQALPGRSRAGLPRPMGQFEQDPHLVAYQEQMYEMMPRYPGAAQELAHQAAMVGRQADLRTGRHMMMKLRRPAAYCKPGL